MAKTGFDRIARVYRWLEYLSFGPALERCRLLQLDAMQPARRALVLGDGDGRFTTRLLAANRRVRVVAVDNSLPMLALLAGRVRGIGAAERLNVVAGDALVLLGHTHSVSPHGNAARAELQPPEGFDLVVTHFFLDCLSTAQVRLLVRGVRASLAPGAIWVVSEFATPTPWAKWVVRGLYGGFRLLAGLGVQALPAYATVLREQGFTQIKDARLLSGLLVSSLWVLRIHAELAQTDKEATRLAGAPSHPAS